MKNDLLINRHIGITPQDEETMLRKIGVSSLDELIDKTIPSNIRLDKPLDLPEPMTEYEFAGHIAQLASKPVTQLCIQIVMIITFPRR